jgi:GNAT superfamily N-acetyltransferase
MDVGVMIRNVNPKAIIRRATAADAEAVSSLNADVQALHAAHLPWWFKPPGPESFPPAAAVAVIAESKNLVFLAVMGEEAVGYLYAEVIRQKETPLRYAYDMVYIHHISVRPAYRGQGIGSALVEAVRAAAAEVGIALLATDTLFFNARAQAFFRRHGFTPFTERLWTR